MRSLFLILLRSIPACAGEPRCPGESVWRQTVYPRVCGGTTVTLTESVFSAGLSPRVRGNPIMIITAVAFIGSIPACAGEPLLKNGGTGFNTVYPRVCGGTTLSETWPQVLRGLSPRVRGNHESDVAAMRRERSIPACAGEPVAMVTSLFTVGSIPACAGEPHALMRIGVSHWRVYPRVCGGTDFALLVAYFLRGLSPRVRGNPYPPPYHRVDSGSIPACAGEPRQGR